MVLGALAVIGALFAVGKTWTAPLQEQADISLSLWALPKYTLYTLSRGLIAFALSIVFTIAYGTAAARSRTTERVMIPVLDVLQSIPVLSFIPGLVIGLEALFPKWNMGLEMACVLAIFTGQVWNMTFSYHASLRSIPSEQREVATLFRFGRWKTISGLELPSAMIGLVWNSMMSMAGGWFFITVIEYFKLEGRQFCIPGLGSYMGVAMKHKDRAAEWGAVVAMIVMVVVVDQLLWRPVLVWAERFRNEETASADKPTSWAYDLLHRSRIVEWLRGLRRSSAGRDAPAPVAAEAPHGGPLGRAARTAATVLCVFAATVAVGWGGWMLFELLAPVRADEWLAILRALGYTALRVASALVVGIAWTVPAGIAIGRSPKLSKALQPIIQIAASFPAPMLYGFVIPVLLMAHASFDVIAVVLMLLGTQWYVLFNVAGGAVAVPSDLREAAAAFRLAGLRRFVVVFLAAVFPMLVTGVITAAGGAWNASVVAEVADYEGGTITVDGIGSMIANALDHKQYSTLAAATVALSVLLVLVNRFCWKPLHRIADERFSLNR